MRRWTNRRIGPVAIALILILMGTPTALAQTGTPIPTPEASQGATETSTTATPTENFDPTQTGSVVSPTALAEFQATNTLSDDDTVVGDEPAPEAEIVVEPKQPAGRDHADVAATERPCAEWGVLPPAAIDEESATQEPTAAELEAAHLAFIVAVNGGGDPVAARLDTKPLKSPLRHQPASRFLLQEVIDVEAVFQIFQDIQDTLDATADALNSLWTVPDGDCIVEYYCGAERIDDFISGRIDSEPSGAYADYVTTVATELASLSADIRDIEANPVLTAGEQAPTIPSPTSPESIVSLTGYLADQGLGESPEGLFAPVFQHCRIGEGGPIEIDDTVPDFLRPSFSWTSLADEFDITRASNDILDSVTRTLQGQLPEMRTTPPIDTGVTIVQFPMWLWLDEPFLETSIFAISDLRTVRVQGQAVFDHVTWTLGEHEVVCTLEQMQAWIPNTNLDPAAPPDCHHIFRELATYTTTAAVTYRIQQDVARIAAPGYPWPAPNWQPHPTTPTVTISSTSPEITVNEIRSVNVPQDYNDD